MKDSIWGGYINPVNKKLFITSQSIIDASGEISYIELSEAKRHGIKIKYYPVEMNQKAIERALKQN